MIVDGSIERTPDGWFYFDRNGKDYGPYESEEKARIKGPEAAKREEEMLKGKRAL